MEKQQIDTIKGGHHLAQGKGKSIGLTSNRLKVIAILISQFIKSVYVYRDDTLEIEFNVSFEEFKTMATECQEQSCNKQPIVYVTA